MPVNQVPSPPYLSFVSPPPKPLTGPKLSSPLYSYVWHTICTEHKLVDHTSPLHPPWDPGARLLLWLLMGAGPGDTAWIAPCNRPSQTQHQSSWGTAVGQAGTFRMSLEGKGNKRGPTGFLGCLPRGLRPPALITTHSSPSVKPHPPRPFPVF